MLKHYLEKVVSTEQGQELANELGIPFLETSAKANINVEEAFVALARFVFFSFLFALSDWLYRDIKVRLIDTASGPAGSSSSTAAGGNVNVSQGANKSTGGCC